MVDDVVVVSTPGKTIDVLVIDHGIAVNQRCQDNIDRLKNSECR